MKEISKSIKNKISSIGNTQKAKWLENYIKHNIKSKGVGIPDIRKIVIAETKNYKINTLDISKQINLLNYLMSSEYTEDKLSAILYIQLYWNGNNEKETISVISNWFDKKWISDWNVCDWLCVRLLSPLVDKDPEQTITVFRKWNKDSYVWKARASLVPFAQCKSLKAHLEVIDKFNKTLIKRDERFCKTAVGWVLREISKFDKNYVVKFLEAHNPHVTSEVKNNANKYFHV